MKYKGFTPEIWQKIEKALDQELATSQTPPIAAFDADGTLWDADLGENFFRWQIAQRVLKNLPPDPWKHYHDWKESGDPRPAYLWLAQINQGHSLQEVDAWAEAAVKSIEPLPIFPEQKKLIEFFLSRGVKVYIITASVKWAVVPGAKRLGLSANDVLGVCTKIKNDVVTSEQEGLITYREGKSAALLALTDNKKPFFACGNTMGDFQLLQSASRIALAVGTAQPTQKLFATEEELRQKSQQHGWLSHRF